jgi:hypothetical protein
MSRNRVLAFVAALGLLTVVGLVVVMFREEPAAPRDREAPAATSAPPGAPGGQATAAAPERGELVPTRPKTIADGRRATAEASIQGIVVNESGVPIENATCELFDDVSFIKDRSQEGERRDRQQTTAEGLFFFERARLPFAETFVLKVMHPQWVTERKAIDLRQLEPVIQIRMRPGTAISGTVRTAAGGALAGATVQVCDMNQPALDPSGSIDGETVTDASGRYTVAALSPGHKRVQASMAGHATRDRTGLQLEAGKPATGVDFVLGEGASISGQVFSSEGVPIEGALVSARPVNVSAPFPVKAGQPEDRGEMRRHPDGKERDPGATSEPPPAQPAAPARPVMTLHARSLADGSFTIAGAEIAAYVVTVNARGYVIPEHRPVEAPATGIVFICTPKARILGRVVDDATGHPVERFGVSLATRADEVLLPYNSRRSFGPPKWSGGAFEILDVPPGRFWLVADAPGYAGGRSEEIVVAASDRRQGVEIRLVKGATIRGRVVDSSGAPIAGAAVEPAPASVQEGFLGPLQASFRRDSRGTKTAPDGAFTIPFMLSGSYVLRVTHPGFGPVTTAALGVGAGGDANQPDIVMGRGATIRGRVKLKDGQPDSKAMVSVMPFGNPKGLAEQRTAYTDADGRFEIGGLAPGQHRVMASLREGQANLHEVFQGLSKPNVVTLAEGETKEIEL